VTDALAVLARHPLWAQCVVCGRLFTTDRGFAAHMTSPTSRTCRDPATVRQGRERLVYDPVYGACAGRPGTRRPPAEHPRHGAEPVLGAPQGPAGRGEAAMDRRRRRRPARQPAPNTTRPLEGRRAQCIGCQRQGREP
jgi:hypothetical protein